MFYLPIIDLVFDSWPCVVVFRYTSIQLWKTDKGFKAGIPCRQLVPAGQHLGIVMFVDPLALPKTSKERTARNVWVNFGQQG